MSRSAKAGPEVPGDGIRDEHTTELRAVRKHRPFFMHGCFHARLLSCVSVCLPCRYVHPGSFVVYSKNTHTGSRMQGPESSSEQPCVKED